MKIVIRVIFTVYKPALIFRNPSGEEPEVPLNHRIQGCNTLWFRPSVSQYFTGTLLVLFPSNALSHNKYLLPIPTTILDHNN